MLWVLQCPLIFPCGHSGRCSAKVSGHRLALIPKWCQRVGWGEKINLCELGLDDMNKFNPGTLILCQYQITGVKGKLPHGTSWKIPVQLTHYLYSLSDYCMNIENTRTDIYPIFICPHLCFLPSVSAFVRPHFPYAIFLLSQRENDFFFSFLSPLVRTKVFQNSNNLCSQMITSPLY